MSAMRPEIKEFEKRVCAWLRKNGVQVEYINGYVVCKETATGELEIFNKLAWNKCLNSSYGKNRKKVVRN
jgi:hypothetical protein